MNRFLLTPDGVLHDCLSEAGEPATNGTVTSVSVVTANGVSGTVADPTTTPAITLTLGAITPTSVNSTFTGNGAGLTNLNGTNITTGTVADARLPVVLVGHTLNNSFIGAHTETPYNMGTVGAASTLFIAVSNVITATLTTGVATVFTMPAPVAGKSFLLMLNQAAAGGGSATFTGVKWAGGTAPVITAAGGKSDLISFVSSATGWYGTFIQNF